MKGRITMSAALKIEELTSSKVRQGLTKGKSSNPAIQRLRFRLIKESDASQVITSYDRMHHRHNRS